MTAESLSQSTKATSVMEEDTHGLASPCKHYIQKLDIATGRVVAERTLVLNANGIVFEQDNEETSGRVQDGESD